MGRPHESQAHLPDRAVARIDVSAVEHNCRLIKEKISDRAQLCAVVKANGYGHGDVWCAQAAVAGGASWLAVATAEEAVELRHHHAEQPILVMGALTRADMDVVLHAGAQPVVWEPEFLEAVDRRAAELDLKARVHVKHDSGMGRLGTSGSELVETLVDRVSSSENMELGGLMTHFATADEPDDDYLAQQLSRFAPLAKSVKERYSHCIVHAANSAATFRDPSTHFDMVRCGISIYGMDPFHRDPEALGLRQALTLESYVAAVKLIEPGESAGYGRTWRADKPTWIAVVPIGYGDGVRRGLSNNGEVLIGARRYPIVGTVSMDNLTVELGATSDVDVGDVVVLIGKQHRQRILAEQVAQRLGTINYEVTCGIAPRVRRAYSRLSESS